MSSGISCYVPYFLPLCFLTDLFFEFQELLVCLTREKNVLQVLDLSHRRLFHCCLESTFSTTISNTTLAYVCTCDL